MADKNKKLELDEFVDDGVQPGLFTSWKELPPKVQNELNRKAIDAVPDDSAIMEMVGQNPNHDPKVYRN